jgi:hypothetical protein
VNAKRSEILVRLVGVGEGLRQVTLIVLDGQRESLQSIHSRLDQTINQAGEDSGLAVLEGRFGGSMPMTADRCRSSTGARLLNCARNWCGWGEAARVALR